MLLCGIYEFDQWKKDEYQCYVVLMLCGRSQYHQNYQLYQNLTDYTVPSRS